MAVTAYIIFDGNCREAAEHYARVFHAEKPEIHTFGDISEQEDFPLPEEAKGLVMHTRLSFCGGMLMMSDSFPGVPYSAGNNISIALTCSEQASVEEYFAGLAEEGHILMELQETEWSPCFGSLVDKFGIHWQINCGEA